MHASQLFTVVSLVSEFSILVAVLILVEVELPEPCDSTCLILFTVVNLVFEWGYL